MKTAIRGLGIAVSLMLVSTAAVLPLASAQSTAAHVYIQVQGPAGAVYGYSASSSGQLTAIPGSPFKPGTAIIGSNNTEFFTLGKTTLRSFAVGSNGAIGSQVGSAAILDYGGNACGSGTGAPTTRCSITRGNTSTFCFRARATVPAPRTRLT
jgi:hypothetical protein